MNTTITAASALYSFKLSNGEAEEIECIYTPADSFHMALPVNVYYRKLGTDGGITWFREIKPACWFEAFHAMRMGLTLPYHCELS